jgi:hypothetical protein
MENKDSTAGTADIQVGKYIITRTEISTSSLQVPANKD